MKRSELAVGVEYVTDSGLQVAVRDTDPGWIVVDGQAKRDLAQGVRYMSAKEEQSTYQMNVNVLVDWTRSDGSVVPLAMAPRALRATWEQYETLPIWQRPEMLKYGWDAYAKRRPDIEQESVDRNALATRWEQRLKAAGCVAADVELSKDGQEVTVSAKSLHKLLSNAGV